MDSSGEGEDFQDIWTKTLRERGCGQRGPRCCTELLGLGETAERHGECGKDGETRCWQVGGQGRMTGKMQATGADDSDEQDARISGSAQ